MGRPFDGDTDTIRCRHCGTVVPRDAFLTTCPSCLRDLADRPAAPTTGRPTSPIPPPSMVPVPGVLGEMTSPGLGRVVPTAVRLQMKFGTVWAFVGWMLLAIELPLSLAMLRLSSLADVTEFRGALSRSDGRVTAVEATSAHEGRRGADSGTVYRVRFEWTGPDGRLRYGSSYVRGRRAQPGQTLPLEYPSDRPDTARLTGMRTGMIPLWVAVMVAALGLPGVAMVGLSLAAARRAIWLLAHGATASGEVLQRKPTMSHVNGRTVIRHEVQFTDALGRPQRIWVSTHRTERMETPEGLTVLYDPACPERAVVLGALPGPPRFSPRGQWETPCPGVAMAGLILPVLTIVATAIVGVVVGR
ncbi:MAG TPA: DUF3592 domain-containing protein [Armatimonadota bacterium]|nr:DUF3592 domain-containing protein [Armatimonadota bacterium]